MPIVFHGHPGPGRTVKAIALVAADNFSARYDLDRQRGVFSPPQPRTLWRELRWQNSCPEHGKGRRCIRLDD